MTPARVNEIAAINVTARLMVDRPDKEQYGSGVPPRLHEISPQDEADAHKTQQHGLEIVSVESANERNTKRDYTNEH
jgi:hypothetical protein